MSRGLTLAHCSRHPQTWRGFPTGTEKVRQAQECGQLHVVNPDWLWSCLERWDHVEEQLFPLREDCGRAHR